MQSFEEAIASSDVMFVVGSGVSAAISGRAATATWQGLLRSGGERAMRLTPSLGAEWGELVEGMLKYGSSNQNAQSLVHAAGFVADEIRKLGDVAFARWLSDDLGSLVVQDQELANVLLSFPFPILTTNYDTLLEEVGSRNSADWTDTKGFHDVVSRNSGAIGHLHGIWNRPSSVVLSAQDYERLRADESAQALQRAITSLRSIIYIGFGGGLSDPNFGSLLEWQRRVLPESSVVHYRLCLDSEVDELRRIHADDHMVPVPYGASHGDLVGFLERLAPAARSLEVNEVGIALDLVHQARVNIRESLSADSMLAEIGAMELETVDLVFPPILLPVPHATFVREQFQPSTRADRRRSDGQKEVEAYDFIVVVGDEGSGLTTAVKWLAAQSSETLGSAAPVFVRFADCRVRADPLGLAVVNAAKSLGLVRKKQDPLPPHVLAVDDLSPSVSRMSDAVIEQVAKSPAIATIVGCREGDEEQLTAKLKVMGVTPRVLFLGRMRNSDIRAFAERFAPGQGSTLAEEAIRVLDAENLRRTPMTVSLLLYMLLRGRALEARNQTGILDAFTSLLIGAGGLYESKTGLSDTDHEAVLAGLAEWMIRLETVSLQEADAHGAIAEILKKMGWQASPTELLSFYLERRLLGRHDGAIEFSRYSYFTLFAAKRAITNRDFKELIANDLFYYEPVAVKLAALSRGDEELLERLIPILDEQLAETASPGSPYEIVQLHEISQLPTADQTRPAGDDGGELGVDDLEFPEPGAGGSFGLVKSDMTALARLQRVLALVSPTLRDLDQTQNLDLKGKALSAVLELWGRLIALMGSDSFTSDVRSALLENKDQVFEGAPGKLNDLVDFLARSLPAAAAFGGIEAKLASPKLAELLAKQVDEGEVVRSNASLTASLFLLLLLQSPGWVERSKQLVEQAESTWVLTDFYLEMCKNSYVQGATPEPPLLELCKLVFLKGRSFSTPAIQGAHVDALQSELRNLRAREKASSRGREV